MLRNATTMTCSSSGLTASIKRWRWLIGSLLAAPVVHALCAVRWRYPGCADHAPAVYGGPLPDLMWAGSSLDWYFIPSIYAANLALIAVLLTPIFFLGRGLRLVWRVGGVLLPLLSSAALFSEFGPGMIAIGSFEAVGGFLPSELRPAGIVGWTQPYYCDDAP